MRKGVERWTATATVVVGVAVLAVALYARAGEALATQAAPCSAPPFLRRRWISQARSSRSSRPTASSATARTSARAACRWPRTPTCSTAGAAARSSGPAGRPTACCWRASGRPSWAIECRSTHSPLTDAEIATLRRWIDQGARLTPSSPPAPPPWEAPLALTAPAVPAAVWARWNRPADRLVAAYLSKARFPSRRSSPTPRSRAAPISTSGACCRRETSCRRLSPTRLPTSAIGSSRRCSPTTRSTPSTGCRSGTTCCATRTA